MKNYSEIEELDAKCINEISSRIFKENNNWDNIYEELNDVYNNIPSLGYLNCFEEDGKYYCK